MAVSSPTDHTALLVAVGEAVGKEGERFQSYLVTRGVEKPCRYCSLLEKPYVHHKRCQKYSSLPIFTGLWGKHLQFLSVAKEDLGTAIVAGSPPPLGRSLLPSCRVRISEKAGVTRGEQGR